MPNTCRVVFTYCVVSNQSDVHSSRQVLRLKFCLFVYFLCICVNKSRQRENYRETTKPEVHESGSSGTMRLCVETIVTLLTAVLVSSASVPDSDDGQSVTVGASWLQRRSNVVEEVVHSLDDYDEPTTSTATTSNSTNAHNVSMRRWLNPFNGHKKPQSNEPLYSITVIGTLAVDGWAVTFGTARSGLGGPRPVPFSPYQV